MSTRSLAIVLVFEGRVVADLHDFRLHAALSYLHAFMFCVRC